MIWENAITIFSILVTESVVGWATNESRVYKLKYLSASKSAIPLYVLFPLAAFEKYLSNSNNNIIGKSLLWLTSIRKCSRKDNMNYYSFG